MEKVTLSKIWTNDARIFLPLRRNSDVVLNIMEAYVLDYDHSHVDHQTPIELSPALLFCRLLTYCWLKDMWLVVIPGEVCEQVASQRPADDLVD